MKKSILTLVVFCVVAFNGQASAALSTLISEGSDWQYSNLGNKYSNVDISYYTINWDNLSWTNGNAAFSNSTPSGGYYLPSNTFWAADTDLALQKKITINGTVDNVKLNVAVDNGFILFVNGKKVASAIAEGFTNYWEYTYDVPSSLFIPGENIIQVMAEDHGGLTFFDMKLSANVTATPIPGAAILLFSGLAGLLGLRRKQR